MHTAPGHHDTPAGPPSLAAALKRRWPTFLAIALTALIADGDSEGLAEVLLLLSSAYLGAAVLQRRQAAWVVAIVGTAVVVLLRFQDLVEPAVVLIAIALAFVLWGAVRGQLRRPSVLLL